MTRQSRNFDYRFIDKAKQDLKDYKLDKNKAMLSWIFELLRDIEINGELQGKGYPERLRKDLIGFYSRQINNIDRLVYKIVGNVIIVVSCKGHYHD